MGKDNRVKLDDFDEEELAQKTNNKSAAKIRAELEKKQREKRLKNTESKLRHQSDLTSSKDD